MTPNNPVISIITIAYNAEKYIEQTIMSVVEQTYQDKEFIIIDGSSTDNTLNIIKQYEGKIDRYISEPDEGIADAMNKGIVAASGDYILFLHADDYLLDSDILKKTVPYLKEGCDIYAFSIYISTKKKLEYKYPRGFNWYMNFKTGIYHQGALCKRNLFTRIGSFKKEFAIAMDYEFFLRAYRDGASVHLNEMPISVMRDTGISSRKDWGSLRKRFKEEEMVQNLHCQGLMDKVIYRIYWMAYLPFRRTRSLISGLLNSTLSDFISR